MCPLVCLSLKDTSIELFVHVTMSLFSSIFSFNIVPSCLNFLFFALSVSKVKKDLSSYIYLRNVIPISACVGFFMLASDEEEKGP